MNYRFVRRFKNRFKNRFKTQQTPIEHLLGEEFLCRFV